MCQIFRNDKRFPKYFTDEKLKISVLFVFEIKGTKKAKLFNLLNSHFSIMGGPIDMIFGVRLLKSVISLFFSQNIAKVITI